MEEREKKENQFKQVFVNQTHGFIDISKKKEFWSELANDLHGEFKIKFTVSYDQEMLSLMIPYKNYQIEFEESDSHPLKINCVLKARQKIEFYISFEDTIDKFMKLFGVQDIKIGDEIFDKTYLIEGPDSKIIARILSDNGLKTILLRNNVFSFNCSFQKKDDTLNLISLVSRTIYSKAELSELYKLFCLTIDRMIQLDLI